MNAAPDGCTGALPFFMPASPGERFCIFHSPAPGRKPRGAILYIHPFAEELNKSRRMAALQSRAFAASGYSVLQIDLYGCGDSSGDFGQARWHIWRHDIQLASAWLAERVGAPLILWGLRLGAALALDAATNASGGPPLPAERLVLWHPVLSGATLLDQFLRLRVASGMLSGMTDATFNARRQLQDGHAVEAGGYLLAPELAAAIDRADMAAMTTIAPVCPVSWFEQAVNGAVAPAPARLAQRWRDAGVALDLVVLAGAPFWASAEIVDCPALLAATGSHVP